MSTWRPTRPSSYRTITKIGLRPRYAYAMGWIHRWARLASHAPGIANAMAQLPGAKRVAGIAPERELPKFAPTTFKQWFRRRGPRNKGKPEVILWADTFNNYFHPRRRRGCDRGPGRCRIPRDRPARAALLRPASLRLRIPR